MNIIKKHKYIALIIAGLFLSGCDNPQSNSPVAKTSFSEQVKDTTSQKSEFEKLISNTHGFSNTKIDTDISKNIYIFFDPQCPHCGKLWFNAQDKEVKDLPIIWIPIGFLNDLSMPQAALILGSDDPVATMNQNETLLKNGGKGLEQKIIAPKYLDKIKDNNSAFAQTGGSGVPLLLKLNDSGKVIGASGELEPSMIKDFYLNKINK